MYSLHNMKGLTDEPADRYKELAPEQRSFLEELETVASPEIVERHRLGMLLFNVLRSLLETDEGLYQKICLLANPDIVVSDPETLVAGHLMAPSDSPSRVKLVEYLSDKPNAKKIERLLRE